MLVQKARNGVQKAGRRARSGFTLMEIMVVVAIIVVLAGAATIYVMPLLTGAKEKTAKGDITTLTNAAMTFELNVGRRPASLAELADPSACGGKRLVADDALRDPWGNPYGYDAAGSNNKGDKPDIFCQTPEGKTIGNWTK